jgi:hypothetical protein
MLGTVVLVEDLAVEGAAVATAEIVVTDEVVVVEIAAEVAAVAATETKANGFP